MVNKSCVDRIEFQSPVRTTLGWDTLQPTMLLGTQIRLGVYWLWWQSVEAAWHGFQEADIHVTHTKTGAPWASGSHSSWLLPSMEGLGFIIWHLRRHFLGELRQGSRNFWNRRVVQRLIPPIKKGYVPYSHISGVLNKYHCRQSHHFFRGGHCNPKRRTWAGKGGLIILSVVGCW